MNLTFAVPNTSSFQTNIFNSFSFSPEKIVVHLSHLFSISSPLTNIQPFRIFYSFTDLTYPCFRSTHFLSKAFSYSHKSFLNNITSPLSYVPFFIFLFYPNILFSSFRLTLFFFSPDLFHLYSTDILLKLPFSRLTSLLDSFLPFHSNFFFSSIL